MHRTGIIVVGCLVVGVQCAAASVCGVWVLVCSVQVFGGEYQTVSDPRAVAESRRYLSQMLFDFGRLHLTPADIAAGEEKLTELRALSEAGDMTVVMEQYLTEVQRPLIGAVSG